MRTMYSGTRSREQQRVENMQSDVKSNTDFGQGRQKREAGRERMEKGSSIYQGGANHGKSINSSRFPSAMQPSDI